MSDATTVFLVRHGAHNLLDRVLSGRMPEVRLADTGHDQARRAARRLVDEKVSAIYASPLERCQETAEHIGRALGLPVHSTHGLIEIDCGEWTGLSFDELHRDERWHVWNRERAASCPPGGEPMAAVQSRAVATLEGWREAHRNEAVVAVTHSDVIKAAVCHYLGLSLDRYHAFEVGPASVTTLVAWDGGGKVLALNERVAA